MPPPTPWHHTCRLKPELRSGELTLAEFAADLHEVVTQAGRRPIYEDPAKLFALTYPTHALRELVRDIAARLGGQSRWTPSPQRMRRWRSSCDRLCSTRGAALLTTFPRPNASSSPD